MNSRSARLEHRGALLRVGEEPFGYGCIHPWPELGDVDLEQTLALLSKGKLTRLARRALECAAADAAAREKKVSLFGNLTIPQSHATLMMDEDAFQSAVDAGFRTVKVKVGKDLPGETRFIRGQSSLFPGVRWRLDFNGALSADAVASFLGYLGGDARDRIDFIEDAYEMGTLADVPALGAYGIPMAVDREIEGVRGNFGVAVVKPALNAAGPVLARAEDGGKRVVFTSYMDHPLGQSFAAWEAARAMRSHPAVLGTCGLVTHGLFAPDAFTECLGTPSPTFSPAAGTGLGFDDLLAALEWTPLT